MAYVFGTTFVCDGMDNAKKVKKRKPFLWKNKTKENKTKQKQKQKQNYNAKKLRKRNLLVKGQKHFKRIKRKETNLTIQKVKIKIDSCTCFNSIILM